VADPRQVTFSCLSKKKSPKRRHPGRFAAHTPRDSLRASLRPGARLTRRAQNTRLGLKQKTRDYSRPGSVLGSLRRGFEQPTSGLYAQLFSTPLRRYLGWLDLSSVGARLVSMPIKKINAAAEPFVSPRGSRKRETHKTFCSSPLLHLPVVVARPTTLYSRRPVLSDLWVSYSDAANWT